MKKLLGILILLTVFSFNFSFTQLWIGGAVYPAGNSRQVWSAGGDLEINSSGSPNHSTILNSAGGKVIIGETNQAVTNNTKVYIRCRSANSERIGLHIQTDQTASANVYGLKTTVNGSGIKAMAVHNNTQGEDVFRVLGDGKVFCTELRVRVVPFPDYVFQPDYELMSLSDLNHYIKTNHRLPKMPSAEMVESEGANVGEIQRLTTEKIEEITLYLIELNERVQELELENKKLKDQLILGGPSK